MLARDHNSLAATEWRAGLAFAIHNSYA